MKVSGNVLGLKPTALDMLLRLRERSVGADSFVDPYFAQAIATAALAIGRRVGVTADRRGNVRSVFVGTASDLDIPEHARVRNRDGRLSGVRSIHVVFGNGLLEADLEDMRLYSLDATVAVLPDGPGRLPRVQVAHLLAPNTDGKMWEVLDPVHATHSSLAVLRFDHLVADLESEMKSASNRLLARAGADGGHAQDAGVLVLPVLDSRMDVKWEEAELRALCRTAGVAVADILIQRRSAPDPKTLIGRGKLRELALTGLAKGADLIVFGAALSPSQQRSIASATGVRVIDRNQLILDIFARHAGTVDGRLHVELAQLKYNLPRLSEKDDSMSRLSGGIGALGPGETKLEMERRRARDRIHDLTTRIEKTALQRAQQRKQRVGRDVPLVGIVGYTNAGKSTLFNVLTGADVIAGDRLFATLDPTVRRLWRPDGLDVLLCDTVGFIKAMPEELNGAFRATVEEISNARLLVHVADASDPHLVEQIESVRRILRDLDLGDKPSILVLNKADRQRDDPDFVERAEFLGGMAVSALEKDTLEPLLQAISVAIRPT